MDKNLPLVSFTKEDIDRIKLGSASGSAVVTNLVERLEKEQSRPDIQAHTNHQKHFRDRN